MEYIMKKFISLLSVTLLVLSWANFASACNYMHDGCFADNPDSTELDNAAQFQSAEEVQSNTEEQTSSAVDSPVESEEDAAI